MKKICIPVMSRANYGRLKSVLKSIQDHPRLTLQLIVGGSALLEKYGCIKEIEEDGFQPDAFVYGVVEGDKPSTMADGVGVMIQKYTQLFDLMKPDVVLIHADRHEMLAPAIAASYMNITVAHNQAGEISGTIDDKVRNAITMLADIHFTATEESYCRVSNMLFNDVCVHNVGCPSIDLIKGLDLELSEDFNLKYNGVGADIDFDRPYIVVMQHPVTTEYGDGKDQIIEIIEAIKQVGEQTIWLWPNIDAGNDDISSELRKWREKENPNYVKFYKNFSPEDYYKLINNCSVLVGNTSSGIREGSWLGIPYICIGTRQNFREHGNNTIFVNYDRHEIAGHIKLFSGLKFEPDYRFGDGTSGGKIADILVEV